MPLPQALAARLAKRGIIKLPSQNKEPEPEVPNNLQEEIIAEDYDDTPQPGETQVPPPPESFDKYQGWYSCPNKWNVYHECTPACQEQWTDAKEIDAEYNKRRLKMIAKYPLPPHWQEILDIGISRYYYWNTETDLVSWLPPGHPKCRVSISAAYLRKQMIQDREERLKEEGKTETKPGSEEEEEEESSDEEEGRSRKRKVSSSKEEGESGESSAESIEEGKPTREKKPRERGGRRGGKERGGGRGGKRRAQEKDALDPMDPAAYSECPRGTWASGLPERNEARTGVDSTATGPLFQMRPYPSPGAVLRANSAANSVGPKKPS